MAGEDFAGLAERGERRLMEEEIDERKVSVAVSREREEKDSG